MERLIVIIEMIFLDCVNFHAGKAQLVLLAKFELPTPTKFMGRGVLNEITIEITIYI